MNNLEINKKILEEMQLLCAKIKELQEELKPVNYKYDSLQSYIKDKTEELEGHIFNVQMLRHFI